MLAIFAKVVILAVVKVLEPSTCAPEIIPFPYIDIIPIDIEPEGFTYMFPIFANPAIFALPKLTFPVLDTSDIFEPIDNVEILAVVILAVPVTVVFPIFAVSRLAVVILAVPVIVVFPIFAVSKLAVVILAVPVTVVFPIFAVSKLAVVILALVIKIFPLTS